MFTNEDLNFAVEKGIFTDSSVEEFRLTLSSLNNSPSVDEENFRLIRGFNDIFVAIACTLLLFSSLWALYAITDTAVSMIAGFLAFTILSWLLSEFFIRKRRMAFPAIVLSLAFIGGVAALPFSIAITSPDSEIYFMLTAAVLTIAAYVHWKRFTVPITIAVGTSAGIGLLVIFTLYVFPDVKERLLELQFLCGLLLFVAAMYWDSSDTNRITRNSDVAFWLHIISAPLIINPLFSSFGQVNGDVGLSNIAVVTALYLLMTLISIVIDRRAFMVSSLMYVLFAFSNLIKTYGGIGYSFALTGIFMGGALVLLSAYWHRIRAKLVGRLPDLVKNYIPNVNAGQIDQKAQQTLE